MPSRAFSEPCRGGPKPGQPRSIWQEQEMLDLGMLGLGLVFFVATIAYAYACDRL